MVERPGSRKWWPQLLRQGCWETWLFLSRRSPSDSDSQEPTYYNVPGWLELQPVDSNGEDQ